MNWGWMAGFFDGEGSISLSRAKAGKECYQLRVSVVQAESAPIKEIADALGYGMCRWRGCNGRWQYEWAAYGDRAISFLESILPYVKVKKVQAELALTYLSLPWRSHGTTRGGPRIKRTEEEKTIDKAFCETLRLCKTAHWPEPREMSQEELAGWVMTHPNVMAILA